MYFFDGLLTCRSSWHLGILGINDDDDDDDKIHLQARRILP